MNDAGGRLTEDEFFRAMGAVERAAPRPKAVMVSRATIERARLAADRLFERAGALELELARLGRWRWLRRRRARREMERCLAQAVALRRTFGERAV